MRISHTVRILITSDFLVNAGFSIFAPIFAVFITKQIIGGTIEVVGFAVAIGQITKSILQIPVARYLDRNHGEYDDFYSLMIGSFLLATVPFLYLMATRVGHLYAIEAVFGTGLALAVPPWYAIFTRHIDKMQENTEWSLESIAIGVSSAGSSALSGIIAVRFGFHTVFWVAGFFVICGVVTQIKIYRDLRAFVRRGQVEPLPDRIT